MRRFFGSKAIYTLVLLFLLLAPHPAKAQTLTEIQPLNFGQWAITNNSLQRYFTVQPNGSFSSSPQLVNLIPPQVGIYRVSGFAPFTTITSITVTMLQPLQGGNQDFTMDTFQVVNTNANGAGDVMITLGCTVKTSGNGMGYDDATYTGVLQLDINF